MSVSNADGRMKRLTLLAAVAIAMAAAARADNLLEDPSFEKPKERDRWGLVFEKWGGNVYDPPARFEVGNVARTGRHSCCMVADLNSKIRLISPEIKLGPGRYRVKFYMRGMDIGTGQWNQIMDFSCGFDGKFFPLKKTGNFGWTPVTYVFQMTPEQSARPFRLFVGLWGGGRLWIDDASLERVEEQTALTPEPVIGAEEGSFVAPAPEARRRCRACAVLNAGGAAACRACGQRLDAGTRAADVPPVKILADFEDGSVKPFTGGVYTTENAPQGRGAVRIDKGHIALVGPQDWSQYDYLRFDTFNPSDQPVSMYIEVRDRQTTGYWTRVNQPSVIPPGRSTLTFRTDMYVGEKSRPGRPLLRDQITHFFIAVEKGPVVIDNVRLERLDTESVRFDGLLALDFGTLDSPVMEGFTHTTAAVRYCPERGYGFAGATFWRSFDALQPDALYQDFVTPTSGVFRIDLPDGKYHVVMNIDSPGAYWGEPQVYRRRQVWAAGRLVVDESMDFDRYLQRYFRNAAREDLPGIDTFGEYVERMFDVKEFDVDVVGGRLEIAFKGESWANCLSSLVVYPAARQAEGRRFLQWVAARRRAQFDDYFKQIQPRRSPPPQTEYVVFTRHPNLPVNAWDGPREGEILGEAGLSLAVARGEEAALTFAIQPAGDVGAVDLAVSDLTGESGARLAASHIQAGWIDYRITRVNMDGSVYTVAPRYWHPVPAPAAAGVTRRFWLRLRPPPDAAAGVYRGQIAVKPAKAAHRNIPVAIRVLPFALDPIVDVAVGPWGSGISARWPDSDPAAQEWNWFMFEKALDLLREAGCTSFSGRPTLRAKASGGKIALDTSDADREMALIRAKGFNHLISSYGAKLSMGYRLYGTGEGPDEAAARGAGFADMKSFLKALWSAVDAHAISRNWVPVAWNICDEPVDAAIAAAAANARAHREAAAGLERTTFMGATSMRGNDPKDPHRQLVEALPIPSLNLHDEASLAVLRQAGNRFSFYNSGGRWTFGRYMKMLVVRHGMALRLTWHYNIVAGDPYYALDCREDDYCWYNTDARRTMVPSMSFLSDVLLGLNDYRYLSTLERLLRERPDHPGAAAARKVWEEMMNLTAGKDRQPPASADDPSGVRTYERDRQAVIAAIEGLLK